MFFIYNTFNREWRPEQEWRELLEELHAQENTCQWRLERQGLHQWALQAEGNPPFLLTHDGREATFDGREATQEWRSYLYRELLPLLRKHTAWRPRSTAS